MMPLKQGELIATASPSSLQHSMAVLIADKQPEVITTSSELNKMPNF
ncbi:hypothetical protein JCM19238_2484 [Vibrio ponticus]|nr:hypothetical protein JCM19238_2484 [Vibrio ponticus]